MTIYAVECKCEDDYYNGYTIAIFSTEEKAQTFINTIHEHSRSQYNIVEYDIDSVTKFE